MNGARGFLTFKEKLRDKAAKLIREAVLSCGTEIILDTPVDSGLLRGNWQTSLHTPPAGVKPLKDPSGSETIAALSRAVARLQPASAKRHVMVPVPQARSKTVLPGRPRRA